MTSLTMTKGTLPKLLSNTITQQGWQVRKRGTLMVTEQTLVAPAFKCWIMLNMENEIDAKLYNYLKKNKADYLPYLEKRILALVG